MVEALLAKDTAEREKRVCRAVYLWQRGISRCSAEFYSSLNSCQYVYLGRLYVMPDEVSNKSESHGEVMLFYTN